jgi:hypothetical protein
MVPEQAEKEIARQLAKAAKSRVFRCGIGPIPQVFIGRAEAMVSQDRHASNPPNGSGGDLCDGRIRVWARGRRSKSGLREYRVLLLNQWLRLGGERGIWRLLDFA